MQQTHNITTLVLLPELDKLTAPISYRGYHIFSKISLNNPNFRYDCYEQWAHFKRQYFITTYIHVRLQTTKHTHTQSLSFQSPSSPGMQDISHKKWWGNHDDKKNMTQKQEHMLKHSLQPFPSTISVTK